MFNLIVSVISVALVAALSAASVFYGGKSFTEASAKGDAASIVTHAQQVAGAFSLYSLANGQNSPTSVAALASSSEYLLSAPLPPATIPGSSAYALSFWNVAHSAPGACA
ncbi:MAG: hypothetical protein K2Q10_09660, partial [Rhodospirillales bacterium]|nr:hypothetical protein [Rhodospirillales bacterium]